MFTLAAIIAEAGGGAVPLTQQQCPFDVVPPVVDRPTAPGNGPPDAISHRIEVKGEFLRGQLRNRIFDEKLNVRS